jgi:hypothetical protein
MSIQESKPFTAGKFLITPLTRTIKNGLFTASLSIRRGRGTQTNDRVYSFKPEFDSRENALMYAADQGRNWLINPMAFA